MSGLRAGIAGVVALVVLLLPAVDPSVALAIGAPGRARPSFDQPNLIVVYTDDQRSDTLRRMPALERMAREGVLFTHSYVTTPVWPESREPAHGAARAHARGRAERRGVGAVRPERHDLGEAFDPFEAHGPIRGR